MAKRFALVDPLGKIVKESNNLEKLRKIQDKKYPYPKYTIES